LAGMGGKVDDDAQTRGQQKQLDAIATEPPAKKARLSKNLTMAATAQVRMSFCLSRCLLWTENYYINCLLSTLLGCFNLSTMY
jgi:hypothetical protein